MDVVRFGHLGQFINGSLSLAAFRAWLSSAWCSDLSEAFGGDDELADAVEHALWLFDSGSVDESELRGLMQAAASGKIAAADLDPATSSADRRFVLHPADPWRPRDEQDAATIHHTFAA